MIIMPDGNALVNEMQAALPLFCYSKKRNTKSLAAQGMILSDKTRLEVIMVRDLFEAGGVMCHVSHPHQAGQVMIMSITGLDFRDNGPIDEKITAYANARIEWLKQEERRDLDHGIDERMKLLRSRGYTGSAHKFSRNAPCPCGSGMKYKHCCGK